MMKVRKVEVRTDSAAVSERARRSADEGDKACPKQKAWIASASGRVHDPENRSETQCAIARPMPT
jgi:hypothetical protein